MADYRMKTTFQTAASDSTDKFLLAAAFALGISGSLALKISDFEVWVPAIYSGSVIIVYALLAYLLPRIQLESDQVGDNAYYLGFVLTLTSLSFTLYELSGRDVKAEFIAQVIAGFGIALSSTIVGVAVRVMFLQFRLDLVARDREARLALSDATRQFRSELADTIRGVKYLGVEIRQSLHEHHTELAKSHSVAAQKLYEEMLTSFRSALKPVGDQLIKMTNEVTENAIAAITASAAARAKAEVELAASIEASSKAISLDASRLLASVQAGMEATNIQISGLSKQFEQKIATSTGAITGLSAQFLTQMEETSLLVSRNSESVALISAKAIQEAASTLAGNIVKVSSTVDPAIELLSQTLRQTAMKMTELMAEIEKHAVGIHRITDQTASQRQILAGDLAGVAVAIEAYTKQLRELETSNLANQQEILGKMAILQSAPVPQVQISPAP